MKILWLCNLVFPELSSEFGLKKYESGGWMTGLWSELKRNDKLHLGICVPIYDTFRMKDGIHENYKYYSFHASLNEGALDETEDRFMEILTEFEPDVIHIWGTEYLHSFAMVCACRRHGRLGQVVVNIQGLISICALHYGFGLSETDRTAERKGRSIQDEIDNFKMRGRYEIQLLKNVKHVVGRTEWDRACVLKINPALAYNHCWEFLRAVFYENNVLWDVEKCERHSIFISQAMYPVKGLHLALETIAQLKEQYSDLRVYITGTNLMENDSAYTSYIRKKIDFYNLWDVIVFVGVVSAEEMLQYYIRANVFLSASTIENSSNSICEALRVGVPVVSSYVGGTMSLVEHGKSGFLYPLDAGYMQYYYIKQIFDDDILAMHLSRNAAARSEIINNKGEILKTVSAIYRKAAEDNPDGRG